jgi:hypothetical protein
MTPGITSMTLTWSSVAMVTMTLSGAWWGVPLPLTFVKYGMVAWHRGRGHEVGSRGVSSIRSVGDVGSTPVACQRLLLLILLLRRILVLLIEGGEFGVETLDDVDRSRGWWSDEVGHRVVSAAP